MSKEYVTRESAMQALDHLDRFNGNGLMQDAVQMLVVEPVSQEASDLEVQKAALVELVRKWAGRAGHADGYASELDSDAFACMMAEIADLCLSRQVDNKAEINSGFDQAKLMQLVREFAEVCYGQRRTTEDVGGKLIEYVKSLATPPATTGASTARSIDTIDFHNLLRICMKHGDDYPTHSARLIDYINRHFAGSIGASTVLTDERIERFECLDLFEQWAADNGHEIDSRVAWANDRNSAGFLMWVGWQAAVRTISSTLKSEVAAKASRVVAPFGYAEPACIEEIMKTENKKAGAYIRVYAAPFEGLAGEHRPTVAVYAPSPAKESK